MKTALFDFNLPESLIAARPAEPRDSARMLVVQGESLADRGVADLPLFLRPGDVLVMNDTRVIPARLLGRRGLPTPKRSSGFAQAGEAKVEVLLHKPIPALAAGAGSHADPDPAVRRGEWHCFAKPAKKLKPGDRIIFAGDFSAEVMEKLPDGQVALRFDAAGFFDKLARYGHMPLPPYIARADDATDRERYQTVYAKREGSVAAPTAGLHFTERLLAAVDAAGVKRVRVTLHVGGGTFLPVKAEDTGDHVMHSEYAEISEETAATINAARAAGGRVIALGTTSLRVLESVADEAGRVHAFAGETDIFITPGYRFRAVDALLTNFHLPRSTLFMLVCAFCGLERMQAAYRHAIALNYRFYSYGDACLLLPET